MTESELSQQIRLLGEDKVLKYFPRCIAALAYRKDVEERIKRMGQ